MMACYVWPSIITFKFSLYEVLINSLKTKNKHMKGESSSQWKFPVQYRSSPLSNPAPPQKRAAVADKTAAELTDSIRDKEKLLQEYKERVEAMRAADENKGTEIRWDGHGTLILVFRAGFGASSSPVFLKWFL